MGIGDADAGDQAPLQVTQFEADIRIANQLTKIWLEQGGGGNSYESYILPWLFAHERTKIDCFEKRGKKGYIFTIGDEGIQPKISKGVAKRFANIDLQMDSITARELYDLVSERYHVFHLMVEQGRYMRSDREKVISSWNKVIGQNAILLNDYTKLSQLVTSTIQLNEGMDIDAVLESWETDVADSVNRSLRGVNFRR
jgi:hypothetical protein